MLWPVINESYESFDVINRLYFQYNHACLDTGRGKYYKSNGGSVAEGFVYTRPVRRLWSGVQYGDVFAGARRRGISAFRACADAAADYYHCGGQPFQHSVGVCNGRNAAQTFYKISTGLEKEELGTYLSILAEEASPYKRFSFMINLNAPTGMAGEAVYAPYLVLSEEKSKYPVLKAENPVFREDEPNMNAFAVEKLLKVFSINPKTVMRYTDADENIIFVQSQATLKVSTDGVMTYTTVAGSKGLAIEGIGAGAAARRTY